MKTLIWKEWREQRLFFFLAVGFVILYGLASLIWPRISCLNGRNVWCFVIVLLPIVFSSGLSTSSFTSDFTKKTLDFNLSSPISSAKIFWVKFLFNLTLLFVLVLITKLLLRISADDYARFFLGGVGYGSPEKFFPVIIFFIFILVLYSAACFSSLLFKNVTTAIICTPFLIIFGCILLGAALIGLYAIVRIEHRWIIGLLLLFILFISFSFFLWQKAVAKEGSFGKITAIVSIAAICFSFIVHGICILAGGVELKQTLAQAEKAGFKLQSEQLIPPPLPDKENAAIIYQEAFTLADKLAKEHGNELPGIVSGRRVQFEELSPQQKKALTQLLLNDPEFIKLYGLIEKAVNLPSCRFDIKYGEGASLPHLSKIRYLANLEALRAYLFSEEKEYKRAIASARTGLRLGDALTNEFTFISSLVRETIDETAMHSFQPILNSYPGNNLIDDYRKVISEIDKKDKKFTKGLEAELAFGNSRLKTHSNFLDLTDFVIVYGEKESFGRKIFKKIFGGYLAKPLFEQDHIFYIQKMTTLITLSNGPFFLEKEKIHEWERSLIPYIDRFNKHPISSVLFQLRDRSVQLQADYEAKLECFKLALALKIYRQGHGNYPEQLASLSPEVIPELPLDPFTGKDYVYHKEGRGFILYSIGPNERDDNGIYDQKQSQKFDDIAWKVLN